MSTVNVCYVSEKYRRDLCGANKKLLLEIPYDVGTLSEAAFRLNKIVEPPLGQIFKLLYLR